MGDFSHFELHRTERKLSCTRNSGGIIIYVRNNLVSEETLFAKRDDAHIWLRLKHELFNFDNDLFLCLCYIPPSSSSRQSLIEKNIYASIMQDVLEIQNLTNDKCNFLLLGDLNSRIGEMCDYVTDGHATHMPLLPDDYNSDEVIPRRSQDKAVN